MNHIVSKVFFFFLYNVQIFLGVFIVKGKEDALVTKNMVPGESVYGEKRVSVQNEHLSEGAFVFHFIFFYISDGQKIATEYRVWNPFRSKLAAAIMAGVEDVHIFPGARVLYLGAASGTSVSHVSDIVGPVGFLI